jgi:erythromycin esterase-like protein
MATALAVTPLRNKSTREQCERLGAEITELLIGFGTHSGTVAAASDWDGPMEVKQVLASR